MTGWRLAGLALAWLAGVALQLQQRELLPAMALAAEAAVLAIAAVLLLLRCAAARSGAALHRESQGEPAAASPPPAREGAERLMNDSVASGPVAASASPSRRRSAWPGRSTRLAWPIALLVAALAGHAATELRAALRLADELPAELEGVDLDLVGVVASLPQRGASGTRFRFSVERAERHGRPVLLPPLVALGWYAGRHEDAERTPQAALGAGQRWRFTVRLRRPHGNFNPHGFDYELYRFEQGVRANGYVRDAPARLLAEAAGYPVDRLRQRVRDAIERSVDDRRAAGVLAALAVGDQSAIEREDWQLFRNAGIAHLVSISGLHITMFAWLAGMAIGAAWRRSPRAMSLLATPHAARAGGLVCAAAYAVFSGWGVPAQRTVWMLAAVTLLQQAGVRWPWTLVLLAAGVVVTAVDPWALLQPGFWLSFAAVGLLMASAPARAAAAPAAAAAGGLASWPRRLAVAAREGVRTQLVATLGLAPLTLVFFQQVSLVGMVANLVAIPVVTLLVTPLALLGAVAAPLWWAAAAVVQRLTAALAWLVGWPHAVWSAAAAPPWAQACGLAAALLVVMPLPWRLRSLAVPLVLPLALPAPERPAHGSFELVAVDVGQGSALIVRTREHLLVYDAGPQYSRDSDAGDRVLLPLLRARGESRIDRLVLSHRDTDHVGGARSLLEGVQVDELAASLDADHPLMAAVPAVRCVAGERWQWDGVDFEFLWPPAQAYGAAAKPNALSCVLRIAAPGASALAPGDIERAQEAALVREAGERLRADVLIAPHHGSRSSSSDALLDAVAPQAAVFQAGYRSRFGHPAPEVLARYRERGIRVATSAHCGAWRWRSGATKEATCERELRRRYWHHRGAAAPEDRP